MSKSGKITVLKGGISSEREVSLVTGSAIAGALRSLSYDVTEVDVTSKNFDLPVDCGVVFVGLHGTFGEDGELQELLEKKGVSYTGSGPEACRLAFNKLLARERFQGAGIRVAKGGAWKPGNSVEAPCVLKPVADGSSVGVCIVRSAGDVEEACRLAVERGSSYMVEEYIAGREVSVGVVDGKALPVIELRPKSGFYDYKHKYTDGMTEHLCPAPLEPAVFERLQRDAEKAHAALGCAVYSRVDFIVPESGDPVILELNSHPGMTALSLLPEMAGVAGISFPELCELIMKLSAEVKR